MKRKIFIVALLVICLSVFAYGTIAYYTAESTSHNVITSGNVDIELLEWADTNKRIPFPENGVSGVMPGTAVTKIVEIENTGGNAAYVRIKVTKTIDLMAGIAGEVNPALVGIDFNNTNWTLQDGFYYYNTALEPGATTEPLFTSVSFDRDINDLYRNSNIRIGVTAYATQVANNGNSALTASGWPNG